MWIFSKEVYGDDGEDYEVNICKTEEELEQKKEECHEANSGEINGIEHVVYNTEKIHTVTQLFNVFGINRLLWDLPELNDVFTNLRKECSEILELNE